MGAALSVAQGLQVLGPVQLHLSLVCQLQDEGQTWSTGSSHQKLLNVWADRNGGSLEAAGIVSSQAAPHWQSV
ncbi:hypothetical protein H920_07321 [Fukomys damarensis]|uniref:Uncharacterized protein n=1 Tax=Fukomys damarensis TaxID=885580 RepID=A0A091DJM6_FUKDA|nr:hypothetical protein H920_07321 [Fukomys damarensis]